MNQSVPMLALLDCQFFGETDNLLQVQPFGNVIMSVILLAILLAVKNYYTQEGA